MRATISCRRRGEEISGLAGKPRTNEMREWFLSQSANGNDSGEKVRVNRKGFYGDEMHPSPWTDKSLSVSRDNGETNERIASMNHYNFHGGNGL